MAEKRTPTLPTGRTERAVAAAMLERYGGQGIAVADAAEAASLLPELLEPGDTVLVKGSRGVGLEAVAEALAEDN